MDIGIIRGLITVALLILFLGIWAWSWSRKRTTDFEASSRLPLEDDRHMPDAENNEEQTS
jgi:cytochrome c oxidase cbb3-type subunit 4